MDYRTVKEDSVKSVNHLFNKGQLLYSKIRPALQKATIAPCDGLCSADMYPLDTILYTEYVLVFLLSETFTSAVVKDDTRVKMPKTNQNALNMVLIPIPPYAEQIKIASMVRKMTILLQSLR